MPMLLQSTTEDQSWNANASTIYNWKTKKEIQVLLQSTTGEWKMNCECFYNLQLKTKMRYKSF